MSKLKPRVTILLRNSFSPLLFICNWVSIKILSLVAIFVRLKIYSYKRASILVLFVYISHFIIGVSTPVINKFFWFYFAINAISYLRNVSSYTPLTMTPVFPFPTNIFITSSYKYICWREVCGGQISSARNLTAI